MRSLLLNPQVEDLGDWVQQLRFRQLPHLPADMIQLQETAMGGVLAFNPKRWCSLLTTQSYTPEEHAEMRQSLLALSTDAQQELSLRFKTMGQLDTLRTILNKLRTSRARLALVEEVAKKQKKKKKEDTIDAVLAQMGDPLVWGAMDRVQQDKVRATFRTLRARATADAAETQAAAKAAAEPTTRSLSAWLESLHEINKAGWSLADMGSGISNRAKRAATVPPFDLLDFRKLLAGDQPHLFASHPCAICCLEPGDAEFQGPSALLLYGGRDSDETELFLSDFLVNSPLAGAAAAARRIEPQVLCLACAAFFVQRGEGLARQPVQGFLPCLASGGEEGGEGANLPEGVRAHCYRAVSHAFGAGRQLSTLWRILCGGLSLVNSQSVADDGDGADGVGALQTATGGWVQYLADCIMTTPSFTEADAVHMTLRQAVGTTLEDIVWERQSYAASMALLTLHRQLAPEPKIQRAQAYARTAFARMVVKHVLRWFKPEAAALLPRGGAVRDLLHSLCFDTQGVGIPQFGSARACTPAQMLDSKLWAALLPAGADTHPTLRALKRAFACWGPVPSVTLPCLLLALQGRRHGFFLRRYFFGGFSLSMVCMYVFCVFFFHFLCFVVVVGVYIYIYIYILLLCL